MDAMQLDRQLDRAFPVRIVNFRPKLLALPPPPSAIAIEPIGPGVFSFHGSILSELDDYMRHIDVMRSHDPEAYHCYSTIGARIGSPAGLLAGSMEKLTQRGVKPADAPAFHCIAFTGEKTQTTESTVFVKFLYYNRLHDHVYRVTALYVDTTTKIAWPASFYITAPTTGPCRVHRATEVVYNRIKSRRRAERFSVPQKVAGLPRALRILGAEQKRSPESIAESMLAFAISGAMATDAGLQVRAEKAGRRAVFNVADDVTPEFFKDRDVTVNENGRKKRIFHLVGNYTKSDGTIVAGHSKGLREFAWNGYRVHIGKPGLDFPNPGDLKAPGIEVFGDDPDPVTHMSMTQVGSTMWNVVATWHAQKLKRKKRYRARS